MLGRVAAFGSLVGELRRATAALHKRYWPSGRATGQEQGVLFTGDAVTISVSAAEGHHGNVGYASRAVRSSYIRNRY